MSFALVKIIAMVTMLIDHVGLTFGSDGLRLFSYPTTAVLRTIGRIALPLYAYNIINGWKYTKNKSEYIYRLVLFMSISQIPFSILANKSNFISVFASLRDFISLVFSTAPTNHLILGAVFLTTRFLLYGKRDLKTSIALVFASLFAVLNVSTEANLVYTDSSTLSVFYTLGTAAYVINEIEIFRDSTIEKNMFNQVLRVVSIVSIIYFFCTNSDYSYMGLFLVLALYSARSSKYYQLFIMTVWNFILYWGAPAPYNYFFFASLVSVLIIYLYNGVKGYSPKWFQYFSYIFYPVHLLILGLFVVFKPL